jgi:type VII secretion-associated serine protease mycosin
VRRTVRAGGAAFGAALLTVLLTGVPARADAERDSQWYFARMQLAEAQALGNGGEGVTVAVLDTGIDTTHQDLRGATLPGYDTVHKTPSGNRDGGGHGTGIATLIAGRGHGSGDGLLGVAPRSKVVAVMPAEDPVYAAEGIRWAVAHGAKVINMSFELSAGGDVLQKAVDEAVAADVVLVAGSGNEHRAVGLPAALPGVLAVGSVDKNNKVADFSNFGKELDLVAYGTQIPAARPHNTYTVVQGTSDSTALVSGVAALMRARYPDMSAAEVVDRLTRTATDRGAKGRDDYYGYGQLNPVAALTVPRVKPSATTAAPTDGPATGAPGSTVDPTAATPAAGGLPGWLFFAAIGGLLVIVAGAVFMMVRVRRGS